MTPTGLTTEVCCRPLAQAERPFRSPRDIAGFEASNPGQGHIKTELGCHINDRMVSFFAQTPSGFQVDYSHGGIEIDDDTWQVKTHQEASTWGHCAPAVPAAATA